MFYNKSIYTYCSVAIIKEILVYNNFICKHRRSGELKTKEYIPSLKAPSKLRPGAIFPGAD